MSFLQIRFPDTGHTYQVPADVVQRHRDSAGSDLPLESYLVLGGMPWDEIAPHATLAEFEAPTRDMTKSAVKAVPGKTACTSPQSANQVVEAPVEQLLSSTIDTGGMFGCYVVRAADGSPLAAVMVVTSDPRAVAATIQSFVNTRNQVVEAIAQARSFSH